MTNLIVGLGNPEPRFFNNRHNVGFMILDHIQKENNLSWKKQFTGQVAIAKDFILLKPETYMNSSGECVLPVSNFYKVKTIVVIHDDIDIPLGKIKIKTGGGTAGHNGIKSVIQHCKNGFIRVRIGVSRPDKDTYSYVLEDFPESELSILSNVIAEAHLVTDCIIYQGLSEAMNKYNKKDKKC